MQRSTRVLYSWGLVGLAHALVSPASLDAQSTRPYLSSLASNVVVPQRRAVPLRPGGRVDLTAVSAGVEIVERVATTTLELQLRNPGPSRAEAQLLVPVPDGSAVRGFTFEGTASEASAVVLPRDDARKIYEAIVREARDPALLEFAGYNLIRSSVFPVEAGGTQKVRLTYEHVLEADGDRLDFVVPRSESLEYHVPWHVSLRIRSRRPISTVYSPSHDVGTVRKGPGEVTVKTSPAASRVPGAFRLSILLQQNGMSASLLAYPDPKVGGGYFLLLGGLPGGGAPADGPTIKREVTLVLDRSGSMSGEKIEQVRAAARQIIGGLDEGEAFNIISYNQTVDLFAPKAVLKTRETEARAGEYLRDLGARGGTNIHDALIEALRMEPVAGMLPIVLFLTDGLPTVGQTSEVAIRDVVRKGNPHGRRVFSFGVGFDVNTPLLERIASVSRGTATFVLPGEDVEVKVTGVFRKLSGPALAAPRLETVDTEGRVVTGRIRDLAPPQLPDLFEGDQLIVLGRYRGEEPLRMILKGNFRGAERTFQFNFSLDGASARNSFVPRLWASRTIAHLEDAIRDLGADSSFPAQNLQGANDPRLNELVQEIVRLSTEFGILSEYTAFLAREGTDLTRLDKVYYEANGNFVNRSLNVRSGRDGANQDINRQYQKLQSRLNYSNEYWDATMRRVSVSNVRQVADRAFFRRRGRWVDSRLVDKLQSLGSPREVVFGSEDYQKLLEQLVREGRQGCVALEGEILLELAGETVLVKSPGVAVPNVAPAAKTEVDRAK